jgi:hypothetical protein
MANARAKKIVTGWLLMKASMVFMRSQLLSGLGIPSVSVCYRDGYLP